MNMQLEPVLDRAIQSGKIFSVKFQKRTTGEIRKMLCRGGVRKFLKGGKLNYDPDRKRLKVVFDLQKMAYRTINLDGLTEIHFHGVHYSK